MSKRFNANYVAFLILFLSPIASADHPTLTSGINGSGPITTTAAGTFSSGAFALGIQTEYIDNDEFSAEQLEDFAGLGLEGVHSGDQLTNTTVTLSYGISSKLSITARLPYIQRDRIAEGEIEGGVPEAHFHGDSSGVGDLLLISQYRLLSSDTVDASVNFGVKAPTGETDVRDDDGARFESEFQPGSGSWDALLGFSVSKQSGALGFHTSLLYNKTTEGSQSTEIGDLFSYNAAITYAAGGENHESHNHSHPVTWDYMVELNGEHRSRNKVFSETEEHSGGNILYLSPGIRLSSEKLGGFLSIGLPIVENQYGTQADIKHRIVAGLSLAL